MKTYVGRGAGAFIENQVLTAKERLYICSPWISPKYAEKLVQLAKSGVEVKIITSLADENKKTVEYLLEELKPPKKLFGLLKDKKWIPPNLELIVVEEKFIHAKIYVVDGAYAVTGSANFTESGLWHNIEYVVAFEGDEAKQVERDYLTLWDMYKAEKKGVEEVITLDDIAKKVGMTVKELITMFKK